MTPAVTQLAIALADVVGRGDPTYTVQPARYVLLKLASACTGYSIRALEHKIADGVWLEGAEFVRAPDGRVLVDLLGYERWAVGRRHGKV